MNIRLNLRHFILCVSWEYRISPGSTEAVKWYNLSVKIETSYCCIYSFFYDDDDAFLITVLSLFYKICKRKYIENTVDNNIQEESPKKVNVTYRISVCKTCFMWF